MSFLLKLIFIFSFINISTSLRQTRYSNDFFFDKEAAIIESQLYLYFDKYINQDQIPDFIREFLNKMIVYLSKFLQRTEIIPTSLIFDFDLFNCLEDMYKSYTTFNSSGTYIFLESTGKSMNDFGNERYCRNSGIEKKIGNNKTININDEIAPNYYILQAYLDNATQMTNEEDDKFYSFFDQPCFYIGICLPYNCSNILNKIINNIDFRSYIYENLFVSNFTLFNGKDVYEKYEKELSLIGKAIKWAFYAIFLLKFVFGILRFVIFNKGYERAIKEDFKKNDSIEFDLDNDKEKINNEENKNEVEENSDSLSSDKIKSSKSNKKDTEYANEYFKYIYGISTREEDDLFNPFHDNEKKLPKLIKIFKVLDLFDNIKLLISVSNKYYNSCCIKRIYPIKMLVLLCSITLQLMVNQTVLPSTSFLTTSLYKKGIFFLIKICVFSSVFWIILDAMDVGFKLMSYIKKKKRTEKTGEISFLSFAKFLLLLIPKIFLFLLCYIFLHILAKYFIYSLSSEYHRGPFILFDKVINKVNYSLRNLRKENLLTNIAPIWINYLDYFIEDDPNKDKKIINFTTYETNKLDKNYYQFYEYNLTNYIVPSPFLTNTDLFINIYLNEFALLIFMLFITYLSYKIKNKKGNMYFDILILVINIIAYLIPAFNWTKYEIKKDERYTLLHVLGQNNSEKYTHYFINFYYFGFMLGVMLFYQNENIYQQSISKLEDSINSSSMSFSHKSSYNTFQLNNEFPFMPFSLFGIIISHVNKIKTGIKYFIHIFSVCFIVLISASFDIIQKEYPKDDAFIKDKFKLRIPIIHNDGFLKFIFFYEKNLCCIFFFIFLLMLIVFPNDSILLKFFNLNFFVIFERIGFSIFCTHNFFIIASFCVFYLDFKINITNIILTSFGQFMLLIVVNVLIVCSFELPLRIFIKYKMNNKITEEFKDNFISEGLYNQTGRTTLNEFKKESIL